MARGSRFILSNNFRGHNIECRFSWRCLATTGKMINEGKKGGGKEETKDEKEEEDRVGQEIRGEDEMRDVRR